MIDPQKVSIVHWFAEKERNKCGYCKGEAGSVSYGMWADTLSVDDYQDLIDRGWRRSGKYCYKSIMEETCCPLYTIRCDAKKFALTKSQKKVIKKLNKYINDDTMHMNAASDNKSEESGEAHTQIFYRESHKDTVKIAQLVPDENITLKSTECKPETSETTSTPSTSTTDSVTEVKVESEKECQRTAVKKGCGADPHKPPSKKAKLLRYERKQQKLLKQGLSLEKKESEKNVKDLEQFLNEISENSKHKLTMKLIRTSRPGKEWEEVKDIEYMLYRKYQMVVHNDPPEKCTVRGFTRFLVTSPLQIKTVYMHKKHEHFHLSAVLYKKYQMTVHNETEDECNERQFLDFLVDTPLQPEPFDEDADGPGYGSYHQQYWIDDRLVAVGVIDILPKCVSSVYFFYDPDYRGLTLGTYGSLREVEFARSLNKKYPTIQYYYMGFYIHSCQKMRYKGKLTPSFLLCPETYTWIPIEKCLSKLDVTKYARLNDDPNAVDENRCSIADVDDIKVIVGYRVTVFGVYKQRFGKQDVFDNVGKLVGKKCAKELLFNLSN